MQFEAHHSTSGLEIVREVFFQIYLDELLGKLNLVKCPEARVQGSIDTSPSSPPKEDFTKSVSMRTCALESRPASSLACLLAS